MKHNTVVAEISQYHATRKRIAQNTLELVNFRRSNFSEKALKSP